MFKQESRLEIGKKYKRGICWGVWDGLHVGHLNLISEASKRCKKLYIGISTDIYVLDKKGYKPMFNQEERFLHIQKYVSKFYSRSFYQFRGQSKSVITKFFKPDVIFVGDDWKDKDWDGAKLGIPVVYLPRTPHISSTKLRKDNA